jgi:hypothetical protein
VRPLKIAVRDCAGVPALVFKTKVFTFVLDSLSSCDFGTLARLRLSIGVDKMCTTLHSISDLSNGILQTR